MNKVIFFLIGTVLIFSCKQDQENAVTDNSIHLEASKSEVPNSSAENNEETASSPMESQVPDDRKIIRTGDIAFETVDAKKTRKKLDSLIAVHQGYVSNENITNYEFKNECVISIKVPSQLFSALVNDISTLAGKLDRKNIQYDDVTSEFIDIQARAKAKKVLENRYLELLAKANKISEMLEIERKLNNVRTDIESMEGRMKWLSNQAALSTLSVTYHELVSDYSKAKKPSRFTEAICGGWDMLVSFLVFTLYLWPFILIGIALIFFFKKYRK
jgi:Domain of unknown function (DUF4349)